MQLVFEVRNFSTDNTDLVHLTQAAKHGQFCISYAHLFLDVSKSSLSVKIGSAFPYCQLRRIEHSRR
jgi:hypothetical protein